MKKQETFFIKLINHEGCWFLNSHDTWCDDFADAEPFDSYNEANKAREDRQPKLCDKNGRPVGKLTIITIRPMN